MIPKRFKCNLNAVSLQQLHCTTRPSCHEARASKPRRKMEIVFSHTKPAGTAPRFMNRPPKSICGMTFRSTTNLGDFK